MERAQGDGVTCCTAPGKNPGSNTLPSLPPTRWAFCKAPTGLPSPEVRKETCVCRLYKASFLRQSRLSRVGCLRRGIWSLPQPCPFGHLTAVLEIFPHCSLVWL